MDPISMIMSWAVSNPTVIPFAGIITFGIFGLFRGWVVPGPLVRERIADKDQQIANITQERDDWKAAAQQSELSRQELAAQNKALLDGAETTNRLLDAMRSLFDRQRGLPDSPPPRELGI